MINLNSTRVPKLQLYIIAISSAWIGILWLGLKLLDIVVWRYIGKYGLEFWN